MHLQTLGLTRAGLDCKCVYIQRGFPVSSFLSLSDVILCVISVSPLILFLISLTECFSDGEDSLTPLLFG